jgi:hypothetical protein
VYYQKCPTCKQTWSAQLGTAKIIRIGEETYTCKCGISWETGRVEWAHLTPQQRRSYFLSTAEVGVLILWPFVGGLFTFFIAKNKWMGLLWGIVGGLLVAAFFVLVMWGFKYMFVRLSLKRCPLDRLSTPTGTGFFDLFRETHGQAGSLEGEMTEPSLQTQLRMIPRRSWLYLIIAAASWIRIEWFWPAMFLCLVLFARSLRKLI